MVNEIAPNTWEHDELALLLSVDEMRLLEPSLVEIEVPEAWIWDYRLEPRISPAVISAESSVPGSPAPGCVPAPTR